MRLNQDLIQRMFDGRGGVAGGGSSLDPGLINGLATEMWTEENYVSKTFFNELFIIHKKTTTTVYDGDTVVSTTTDTSGIFAPNEIPSQEESTDEETGYRTVVVTEVDNIEAKKGLWTDFFLSALGLNGSGGGGGIGDVTWQALGDNTDTRQIASSHLTTALGSALAGYATQSWVTSQNYVTSSAISDMATKTWVNNQSFVNWTALGDTTTTQQIALSHLTTALSGYATQTWVTNNFSTPATVATQLQTYAKIQNGTITIGDTSLTPITSVTGTFWGKSFTNGGTVNGTIKAGSNGGAIEQFHSVEMNSAGTLAGYGGFIDFHYYATGSTFDSTLDYTSRIIESEVGVISILAKNNNATNANKLAGLLVGDGYDGSYVQIGNIRIVYDSTNNALKVVKLVSGSEVAANFYATGSVSALGYGAGGGGGTGDVTWDLLADNTDTRQIAQSHLTTALTNYALTSQLAGYLPLTGGTLTGQLTVNKTSTVYSDNIVTITNGFTSAYPRALTILFPSHITSGANMQYFSTPILFGRAESKNNAGTLSFFYYDNQSTSNAIAFGFHTNDNLMLLNAAGNVGIGTKTPTQKLDVNGNIATAATDGTFVQIGGLRLVYDLTNTAFSVSNSSGTAVTGTFSNGLRVIAPAVNYNEGVVVKASTTGFASLALVDGFTSGAAPTNGLFLALNMLASSFSKYHIAVVDAGSIYRIAIPAKAGQMALTSDITSAVGDYLPLTGGVLTGDLTINLSGNVGVGVTISSANTSYSCIRYLNHGKDWSVGVNTSDFFYFYNEAVTGVVAYLTTSGLFTCNGIDTTNTIVTDDVYPSIQAKHSNVAKMKLGYYPTGTFSYYSNEVIQREIRLYDDGGITFASFKPNATFNYKIWHEGNDGTGSGLDADLLDGQHGSYYATAASLDGYLPLTAGNAKPLTNTLYIQKNSAAGELIALEATNASYTAIQYKIAANIWVSGTDIDTNVGNRFYFWNNNANAIVASISNGGQMTLAAAQGTAPLSVTSTTLNTNLNADLLDGQHGSYYAAASSLSDYLAKTGGVMSGTIQSTTYPVVQSLVSNVAKMNLGYYPTGGFSYFSNETNKYEIRIYDNGDLKYAKWDTSGAVYNIWNANNDGTGSGLDADLLDGQHASYFAPLTSLNNYVLKAGDSMSGKLTISYNAGSNSAEILNLTNTFAGEYARCVDITFPNAPTTNFISPFLFGMGNAKNNKATVSYIYRGNQSNNNALAFGFYANDNLLTIFGSGNVGIGVAMTPPSYKLHVAGTFYASNTATFGSNVVSGTSGGAIEGFHSWELNTHNTAGTNIGGFLDFHYNGTAQDYSVRLIEKDYSGVLQILAKDTGTGNAQRAGLIVGEGTYTSFIQIGNGRIVWNDGDHALRIVDKDGNACNLYATGGISALGYQSGGGGGGSTGVFSTSITPDTTGTYDLGTTTYKWRNLYLAGANGGNGFSIMTSNTGYVYMGAASSKIRIGATLDVLERISICAEANQGSAYDLYVSGDNDGDAYFGGNVSVYSLTQRSDMRYKDIIGDVTLTIQQIASAPVFQFMFKEQRKNKRMLVGTSAQYWDAVMPEVVTRDADGMLGLDYGVTALVSTIILAKGMTEHERRITKLEKENAELRARIKDLEEN